MLTGDNFANWLKDNDLTEEVENATTHWDKLQKKQLTKKNVRDLGKELLFKKIENDWIAGALWTWATGTSESTEKGKALETPKTKNGSRCAN